jgi:RNase P subunit RPR2
MLQQLASIAFCDRCDTSTARFERGWRAYIESVRTGEAHVMITCPACGEQTFGEDEAAWSD